MPPYGRGLRLYYSGQSEKEWQGQEIKRKRKNLYIVKEYT
jgi:hypothetical protein